MATMMSLLNNINYIFTFTNLTVDFLITGSLGLTAFFYTITMCANLSTHIKVLKYILSAVCIALTIKFFIILNYPFLTLQAYEYLFIIQVSVVSVLAWVIMEEYESLINPIKKHIDTLLSK